MKRKPTVPAEYMALLRDFRREEKKRPPPQEEDNGGSDSDVEFEDVRLDDPVDAANSNGLGADAAPEAGNPANGANFDLEDDFNNDGDENTSFGSEHNDVTVSLDAAQAQRITRKKGPSKPERLLTHKLSLLAWMVYSRHRNRWALEPAAHQLLRPVLSPTIIKELHPPPHLTPFLKSRQFVDGLRHAMLAWQDEFRVVDVSSPTSFDEFLDTLRQLQGSRDVLGQGFVALMRSASLESRLVCSLQPPDNLNAERVARKSGGPSPSPIFWAEVWDPYALKWAAVDPLTSTVRLPNRSKVKLKLEPALSDTRNIMRYCIAWDHKSHARDVTRRYASNYNARARKKRITYVDDDNSWLDRMYACFANFRLGPRDKDEIAELVKYPRLEGIPQRAQDFVGHPEYALLDQLHHNEVLREGAQHSGVLAQKNSTKPVYIYRRSDVLTCRTAQSWYRSGRSIQQGQQPITHRRQTNKLTGETEEVGMYTFDQTELYKAAPVSEDGTVPKSQYRTIDLFCSTMLPKGAVHIIDKLAVPAAKLLRIDYANAVVAVEYGKRGAQSQYKGIVVARQFAEAVVLVLKGMRKMEKEKARYQEQLRMLGLWRKFIVGVQIWERVEAMNPEKRVDEDESDTESEIEDSGSTRGGVAVDTKGDAGNDSGTDDETSSEAENNSSVSATEGGRNTRNTSNQNARSTTGGDVNATGTTKRAGATEGDRNTSKQNSRSTARGNDNATTAQSESARSTTGGDVNATGITKRASTTEGNSNTKDTIKNSGRSTGGDNNATGTTLNDSTSTANNRARSISGEATDNSGMDLDSSDIEVVGMRQLEDPQPDRPSPSGDSEGDSFDDLDVDEIDI